MKKFLLLITLFLFSSCNDYVQLDNNTNILSMYEYIGDSFHMQLYFRSNEMFLLRWRDYHFTTWNSIDGKYSMSMGKFYFYSDNINIEEIKKISDEEILFSIDGEIYLMKKRY